MLQGILFIALSAVQLVFAVPDYPYYGLKVGDFTTREHSLSGKVYIVDTKRIRIRDLVYDGTAPAAFFWIGLKGSTDSDEPSEKGRAIPDEKGSTAILKKYSKADIVLTLPVDITVENLKWLAVWCKQFSSNFGEVYFPAQLTVPSLFVLGNFSTISHGVRSGFLTVHDSKTVFINDFYYDGNATDVHLVASNDSAFTSGLVKLPRVTGQLQPLAAFDGEDIKLILPQDLTVYNIRFIGVYSFKTSQVFGLITVSLGSSLVPPHVNSPSIPDGRECDDGDEIEPMTNNVSPSAPLPQWYKDIISIVCRTIGQLCHILKI